MKIQINAVENGEMILEKFLAQLKDKNIIAKPEECKILVTNKEGKEVELSPDKIKVVFNKE